MQKELSRRDFIKAAGAGLGALLFNPQAEALALGEIEVSPRMTDRLDARAQYALAARASMLISPTPESATATADFVRNSTLSSADNVCGPIAMAQLIQIVNFGVRSQDYWQVSPVDKRTREGLFEEAFPPSVFDKIRVETPLQDYDFNSWTGIGVQPGDFFYFYSKDHGSDHMMAISRRGADGTLYAISNYPDENKKWVIKEFPFWKPGDPEGSWVKGLAKGENSIGFSSGQRGFFMWRLKTFQDTFYDGAERSTAAETFRKSVNDLARSSVGQWHALFTNLSTGRIIAESGSRIDRHAASVFKVPLAMVFMSYLEGIAKNEADYKDILFNQGTKGRTFDQLVTAMLVLSEEMATGNLTDYLIKNKVDRPGAVKLFGGESTSLSTRHSTDTDMQKFFSEIYRGKVFKYGFTNSYLLKLLSTYSDSDDTRIGKLPKMGVPVAKIYNKRGSIAEKGTVVVADSGIVEIKDKKGKITPYFVSLNGHPRDGSEADYELLEGELFKFVGLFADYLLPSRSGKLAR